MLAVGILCNMAQSPTGLHIHSPGPFYRMGCYFSLWCHINNVYLTLVWEMWDAALDSGSMNKVYQMFA